jgi:hypothetical protein
VRSVKPGDNTVLSRRAFNRRLLAMGSLLAMGTSAWAEDPVFTSSLASDTKKAAPANSKLATQTEVVAGQDQVPMLSVNSAEALQGAIAMYEEFVAGGGWQRLRPGRSRRVPRARR